jgi:hypothetical protein
MIVTRKKMAGVVAACALLLLASCAARPMQFHRLRQLSGPVGCRLGLLPFTIDKGRVDQALSIQRIFQSVLEKQTEFALVPEGDMREAYQRTHLFPGISRPGVEQIQVIANYLDVRYLIWGNVFEIGTVSDESRNNYPVLAFEAILINAPTGQTVWRSYLRKSGEESRTVMHFGTVNNITQLAAAMIEEILAQWAAEGFTGQCTD